jgi:hypothetical protein
MYMSRLWARMSGPPDITLSPVVETVVLAVVVMGWPLTQLSLILIIDSRSRAAGDALCQSG